MEVAYNVLVHFKVEDLFVFFWINFLKLKALVPASYLMMFYLFSK